MTVAELREKLKDVPQDLEVVVHMNHTHAVENIIDVSYDSYAEKQLVEIDAGFCWG